MKVFMLFYRIHGHLDRLVSMMGEGLHMVFSAGNGTRPGAESLASTPVIVPVQAPRRPRVARRWRA